MCNEKTWQFAKDVVFTPSEKGMIASNHRSKHHIWIDLNLINALLGMGSEQTGFYGADLTTPANLDGLYADPTGLSELKITEKTYFKTFNCALEFLIERMIIISDSAEYSAYFNKRDSLIDTRHLGTFHQRLGADLLLRHRTNPEDWWYEQKFNRKTDTLKNNLYKFVQSSFIEEFSAKLNLIDRNALDFGCGNGLASEQFIKNGARVWGLDPNEKLLNIAKSKLSSNFTGIPLRLDNDDILSVIPNIKFDLIWLSDVLMFYFYPPNAGEPILDPVDLLRRLSSYLTEKGKIVIMQPHGCFWLAPWLGDSNRPYTVITEYTHRVYSVSPSLTELSNAFNAAGLVIERIYEPLPKANTEPNARPINFANEFPLWWTFECRRA